MWLGLESMVGLVSSRVRLGRLSKEVGEMAVKITKSICKSGCEKLAFVRSESIHLTFIPGFSL